MAGSVTNPRRRKIFPHLSNNESKQTEGASSSTSTSGLGGASSNSSNNNTGSNSNNSKNKSDNSNNSNSKNNNNDSYDNAKSRRGKKQSSKSSSTNNDSSNNNNKAATAAAAGSNSTSSSPSSSSNATTTPVTTTTTTTTTLHHHLLPLPLVLTVLVCSGLFWIASFRDLMATGKPILDTLGVLWGQDDADANFLQYTKSTAWFEDTRGWKSTQGGLSTIMSTTTDANNMGGLFVRKLSGVAGLSFHTTKLMPVVFHSPPQYHHGKWTGASWSAGHFDPVLILGMMGDVCLGVFYLGRLDELKDAGCGGLGMAFVLTSLLEAFILGMYMLSRRMNHKSQPNVPKVTTSTASARTSTANPLDENPNSLPSRIVARTVSIVSTLISLVSLRDLLLPGAILSFLPRDDIYLEWTGAFLHSPPPDTVEADEHGLESPLFAGDLLVHQLLGLYLFLSCAFKFASAVGWSKGNRSMGSGGGGGGAKAMMMEENAERSGVVSSKMIWKAQALGDVGVLTVLRMFTPAAKSASLDLRWHLMLVAYEAFILSLYGFW